MTITFIDIFMAAIVIRSVFIGKKNGFVVELFKFLGVISATFFSIHYYIRFSDLFKNWLMIPSAVRDFIIFVTLVFVVVGIFALVREGWVALLKIEIYPQMNTWMGGIFAFLRSLLICGLVFLAILISQNDILIEQARQSLSRDFFNTISNDTYRMIYGGFISPFFASEQVNAQVLKVILKN